MTRPFFMDANSLLSKWGFGDGDGLGDWWWEEFDEPFPDEEHLVLRDLVRTHLVPAIEATGRSVTLTDIETIHNPVRAEILDGSEVDWYGDDTIEPPVWVEVSADQVWESIAKMQRSRVRGITTSTQ